MIKIGRFILCIVLSLGFHSMAWSQTNRTYQQEIDQWDQSRKQSLIAENGWLNLVGLYWLEEGRNSFGSDSSNKLVFPKGSIAAHAGYFERNGNLVKIVMEKEVPVEIKGKQMEEALIFDYEKGIEPTVSFGNLRWTIIKRENKIGVRLRDVKSSLVLSFNGIARFAPDTNLRVVALLQKERQPGLISITNVLGQTSLQPSPGLLQFTLHQQTFAFQVLEEGDELFIIFGDATNGKSTYPSGRFVYARKPGPDGKTVLDFNKAFNPPCAFTHFATCPLPPRQNQLAIEINAGEKLYEH